MIDEEPVTINQGIKQMNKAMHKCLIELRDYGNAEEYHNMLKKELKQKHTREK